MLTQCCRGEKVEIRANRRKFMSTLEHSRLLRVLRTALIWEEEGDGRLRGKLDRLNKLGVPDVTRRGTGRRVAYQFAAGFELAVAIKLEAAGMPPQNAAMAAKRARELLPEAKAQE